MTTFLAMIIGGKHDPKLAEPSSRLQLVFTDAFELEKNHFSALCTSTSSILVIIRAEWVEQGIAWAAFLLVGRASITCRS